MASRQVEVIRYNGRLMYLHPLLEELVPAPEGARLGQRLDITVWTNPCEDDPWFAGREIPIDWDGRPKM